MHACRRRLGRPARALEGLPKISDAFRVGQVSYSKVRAMTRVATPAIEDDLLNIACYGTATHKAGIERPTLPYGWCGDRMDYGAGVEALFAGKYPDGFRAGAAAE